MRPALILRFLPGALFLLATTSPVFAQTAPLTPDIDGHFATPHETADYDKRVEMIPMRDGVRLYTVIVVPKGARSAPMILTRTPYNAAGRASRSDSAQMLSMLPQGDEVFVAGGYIRVFQDVRGKYGSEGDYVMTRPLIGPLNNSKVDHSTDAWDTIEWLTKHVPESNGRVGMLGSSYEGFTVVMALVNPHPALKVAAPMSPMVDGWMGDDWFHYGAFRQNNVDYFVSQTVNRGAGISLPRQGFDDYDNFLRAGSLGAWAKSAGLEQRPWWKDVEHPASTASGRNKPSTARWRRSTQRCRRCGFRGCGTRRRHVGGDPQLRGCRTEGLDEHDELSRDGSVAASGVNYEAIHSDLKWKGDTALQFSTRRVEAFFDQYLKEKGAPRLIHRPCSSTTLARITGIACSAGRSATRAAHRRRSRSISRPAVACHSLHQPQAQAGGARAFGDNVSGRRIRFRMPRPVHFANGDIWRQWLLLDQRTVATGRPDVVSYMTAPLTEAVRIGGPTQVNLVASTSGTDSDWVVKLIDVYPDDNASHPEMTAISSVLRWTSSADAIVRASSHRRPSRPASR
ncbi:MAG: CocE/NonD family hydrolase [Vicinamibacterales bacterium]